MKKYPIVTYVLRITLIEIRATESLRKAQVFADVIHNVPGMLSNETPEPKIITQIMAKAKRQGVDQYFSELIEKVERSHAGKQR